MNKLVDKMLYKSLISFLVCSCLALIVQADSLANRDYAEVPGVRRLGFKAEKQLPEMVHIPIDTSPRKSSSSIDRNFSASSEDENSVDEESSDGESSDVEFSGDDANLASHLGREEEISQLVQTLEDHKKLSKRNIVQDGMMASRLLYLTKEVPEKRPVALRIVKDFLLEHKYALGKELESLLVSSGKKEIKLWNKCTKLMSIQVAHEVYKYKDQEFEADLNPRINPVLNDKVFGLMMLDDEQLGFDAYQKGEGLCNVLNYPASASNQSNDFKISSFLYLFYESFENKLITGQIHPSSNLKLQLTMFMLCKNFRNEPLPDESIALLDISHFKNSLEDATVEEGGLEEICDGADPRIYEKIGEWNRIVGELKYNADDGYPISWTLMLRKMLANIKDIFVHSCKEILIEKLDSGLNEIEADESAPRTIDDIKEWMNIVDDAQKRLGFDVTQFSKSHMHYSQYMALDKTLPPANNFNPDHIENVLNPRRERKLNTALAKSANQSMAKKDAYKFGDGLCKSIRDNNKLEYVYKALTKIFEFFFDHEYVKNMSNSNEEKQLISFYNLNIVCYELKHNQLDAKKDARKISYQLRNLLKKQKDFE